MEKYDLIIIGGGPAGLTAAIYAARYKLKTAVFSKTIGGLAATAHIVLNYPSYQETNGFQLMKKIIDHVKSFGVPILYNEVIGVKKDKDGFIISTKKGDYFCKKLLLAMGSERRKLGVPGEAGLSGKGISYCSTCDGSLFKDKIVAVIGGGDAALTSALLLSEYATKVYIIYRKPSFFRAEPSWVEVVEANKKITPIFNEEVIKVHGKDKLEKIDLKSGKEMKLDGLFIEIGSKPDIGCFKEFGLKQDEVGYVEVDKYQKTNLPGVYAAGDMTDNTLKQIINSSGEGAVAAHSIFEECKKDS
tara:strand:- start:16818 stop:17723 length:906 start_codon:yes stop_codon:yes gene_type:complete